MAVDWIGFAYAALLAVGGVVAYTRKGQKGAVMLFLTFGVFWACSFPLIIPAMSTDGELNDIRGSGFFIYKNFGISSIWIMLAVLIRCFYHMAPSQMPVQKRSKISLAAGLTFGSVAGYGAYCVTRDPRNVKISLFSAFLLTIIMGMRFKRSKKLMPAGLVACLSLLMILRLVFMLL